MRRVIEMKAGDALKLHSLHARQMQESCKDSRVYKREAEGAAEKAFSSFYKEIGLLCYLEAERLANTVWHNHDYISALYQRSPDVAVNLVYDLQSDFLFECPVLQAMRR